MVENIFGTDGIRGRANEGFITPDNAMKLAIAAVNYYLNTNHETVNNKFTVVIGKDTRLSGYMLEPALTAGFIASGADVILLGPIPSPGVSFLARSLRADLGVVISASHNPFHDNGIKFFNSNGFKITPNEEKEITKLFYEEPKLISTEYMGKAKRLDDASGRYVEFAKNSFPRDLNLSGLRIVIDTANGAAYKVAPQVFWELGAEIFVIGNAPDGLNINDGCGATDTALLQKTVIERGADIGIALDGDADRVIIVDETGDVLDGDYVIAAIATCWQRSMKMRNNKIVATKMSNMALSKYLNEIGLELEMCDVGDKHVVERMKNIGSQIGGEKSGHIIPMDFTSTGDGLISALQILAFLVKENIKTSYIKKMYTPFPQSFLNVRKILNTDSVKIKGIVNIIENDILLGNGRIIVRKSGTEQLTRIMIESSNQANIEAAMQMLLDAI